MKIQRSSPLVTSMPVWRIVAMTVAAFHAMPAMAQVDGAIADARRDALAIRHIRLFRSGVASVERRGMVMGDRTVQLKFNTDQINDLLKSMVVLDLSGNGSINGIGYDSREPLARRLASFGVNISEDPSLADLLQNLRGAKVTMTLAEGKFTGTILGHEVRQEAEAGARALVPVAYVNLLTEAGIRSLSLADVMEVQLLDKNLAAELQRALEAVSEYRAERTKLVDISLSGKGEREIVVAYVQNAPVWKASYRVILSESAQADPKAAGDDPLIQQVNIQGWAIVENTTDEDWTNISLSLASGMPIGFQMDLYQPLYSLRPLIPVPTVPGASARMYAGAWQSSADAESDSRQDAKMSSRRPASEPSGGVGAKPGSPLAAVNYLASSETQDASKRMSGSDLSEFGAASQAKGVELGEVFEFALDHPITIERQRSAMIPIISSPLSGRRVSIYSCGDGQAHPMRGVELRNTSAVQLLPGPISVFDGATYAGDAQIGHVPPGDKRLLAYSVDLDVDAKASDALQEKVQSVKIAKGAAVFTRLARIERVISLANKDRNRQRTIIVESPVIEGWTLREPARPYETTAELYRFAVNVAPGKTDLLRIVQERVESTSIAITAANLDTVLEYRKQGAEIPDRIVAAIREAQRRASVVAMHQARIESLRKEKSDIGVDQGRIRQNAKSIDSKSDLYSKYIRKLTDQESRLEAIDRESAAAEKAKSDAQNELSTYVQALDAD